MLRLQSFRLTLLETADKTRSVTLSFLFERVNETALGPNAESQEHAFEVELVIRVVGLKF